MIKSDTAQLFNIKFKKVKKGSNKKKISVKKIKNKKNNNKNKHLRKYSTSSNSYSLEPQFITGFADAESSFSVSIYKNTKMKIGWVIQPAFSIGLHIKDLNILLNIKSFFNNTGRIKIDKKNNKVYFVVTLIKDLNNIIIPHFLKFPLLTLKRADFILFCSIIEIINNKEHLNIAGFYKILNLKYNLNKGLKSKLIKLLKDSNYFSEIARPTFKLPDIIPLQWISGLVSGDGSFFVFIGKNVKYKTGYRVDPSFSIGLHDREQAIITLLAKQFNCGSINVSNGAVYYTVRDLNSLTNIIIPFFNNNPIFGIKSLDFADFCKMISLIKNKEHLTESGLKQIININNDINQRRGL